MSKYTELLERFDRATRLDKKMTEVYELMLSEYDAGRATLENVEYAEQEMDAAYDGWLELRGKVAQEITKLTGIEDFDAKRMIDKEYGKVKSLLLQVK